MTSAIRTWRRGDACPWDADEETDAADLFEWVYGHHPVYTAGTSMLNTNLERLPVVGGMLKLGRLAEWLFDEGDATVGGAKNWCMGPIRILTLWALSCEHRRVL